MSDSNSTSSKITQLIVGLNIVLLGAAAFFLHRTVQERDEAQTALVYVLREKEELQNAELERSLAESKMRAEEERIAQEQKREWQLVFQDDFSGADIASRWQILGQWEVKNGELHLYGGEPQVALIKVPISGDVRIEFDCHIEGEMSGDIRCFLAAQSAQKLAEALNTGYVFERPDRENAEMAILRAGAKKESKPTAAIKPGQHYKVRAERIGKRLTFQIEGLATISAEDSQPLTGEAHSAVGLFGWKTHAYYDNVRVYTLGLSDHLAVADVIELLLDKGQAEAALSFADDLLSKNPPTPQRQPMLFFSALAADQLKRAPDALLKLEQCASLDPNSATGIIAALELARRSSQMPERCGDLTFRGKIAQTWAGDDYLCFDQKLEREVVLRTINRKQVDDKQMLQNYLAEIKVLSTLDHPGINRVYRFERLGPFHLIERASTKGESLDAYLRKFDVAQRLSYASSTLKQLLEAIDYYHQKSVVNRDLRPQNILVDATAQLVIQNFANQNGESSPRASVPYCVAPDLLKNPAASDIRDDLYSLGAMYYSILSNRPPYEGQNAAEIQRAAADLNTRPAPLTKSIPGISPEFAQFIEKLMAKSRADRFQTPREALDALKRIQFR